MRPAEELAGLMADLQAWSDWTALRGGVVLPAQELAPRAPEPPPSRPAGRSQQPRRAPERPPTRSAPTSVPASPPGGSAPGRQPAPQGMGRWGAWSAPKAPELPAPSGATLQDVRAALGDCSRCGLCRGRSNIVFGVGAPRARVLVVGEAPSFNEDQSGEPFVGEAGQMLDRMVENVLGLSRAQIYITNAVKCRPPDNRNPEPDEIARCRPFLLAQLKAIAPDLVLILGSVATRAVLGTGQGTTPLRGTWTQVEWEGGRAPAMPTFHPAFLLRQPSEKRKAFEDLKAVREALDRLPPR